MSTTLSNYKNAEKYARTFAHTLSKTTLFCLTTALQFSNVSGYEPGTKAACYDACAQNCSVTIGPMCDPPFNTVVLPILLATGLGFTICTCTGYIFAKDKRLKKEPVCRCQPVCKCQAEKSSSASEE
jgi:hypothetical protein